MLLLKKEILLMAMFSKFLFLETKLFGELFLLFLITFFSPFLSLFLSLFLQLTNYFFFLLV